MVFYLFAYLYVMAMAITVGYLIAQHIIKLRKTDWRDK